MLAPALLLATLWAAPAASAAVEPARDCYRSTESGEAYPVCFDPGRRLELGWAPFFGGTSGQRLSLALRLRSDRPSRSRRDLTWLRDHTLLEAELAAPTFPLDRGTYAVTAWRATLIRHLEEGFILVPTREPIRIPFPFDVGLAAEAGTISGDRQIPGLVHLDVARAALVLDAARNLPALSRLAIGPEIAWSMDFTPGATARHTLVPLTGGVLDLRAESDDGLWVLALRARAGWVMRLPGGLEPAWSARASLERVLLAVNDEPIVLFVAGEGSGDPRGRTLVASAGLKLAWQL